MVNLGKQNSGEKESFIFLLYVFPYCLIVYTSIVNKMLKPVIILRGQVPWLVFW